MKALPPKWIRVIALALVWGGLLIPKVYADIQPRAFSSYDATVQVTDLGDCTTDNEYWIFDDNGQDVGSACQGITDWGSLLDDESVDAPLGQSRFFKALKLGVTHGCNDYADCLSDPEYKGEEITLGWNPLVAGVLAFGMPNALIAPLFLFGALMFGFLTEIILAAVAIWGLWYSISLIKNYLLQRRIDNWDDSIDR